MMEKIMIGVVLLGTLVSSAFSGNMGYVWMASRSHIYDAISYTDFESKYILKEDINRGLPDVNSIITIEAKNRIYYDLSLIQSISKEFISMVKEGKCSDLSSSFSNFMLNLNKEYPECLVDSVLEQAKSSYSKYDHLYYTLQNPIKAKVLGYIELQAGVFVLVEQKELLREEKKDK